MTDSLVIRALLQLTSIVSSCFPKKNIRQLKICTATKQFSLELCDFRGVFGRFPDLVIRSAAFRPTCYDLLKKQFQRLLDSLKSNIINQLGGRTQVHAAQRMHWERLRQQKLYSMDLNLAAQDDPQGFQ